MGGQRGGGRGYVEVDTDSDSQSAVVISSPLDTKFINFCPSV